MESRLRELELVAEGIGFTEGPVWTQDGRLIVVSLSRGLLYEVDERTGAVPFVETGGNPNGVAQAADGTLWIAQGGTHTRTSSDRPVAPGIQALFGAGPVLDVVTSGTRAPNDCAVAPDGTVWFTDPVGPAFEPVGPGGRLCVLDPSSATVTVAAGGLRFPNGLAFGVDPSWLYLAETGRARILRFEVAGSAVSNPVVWADLDGAHPDGLARDCEGRLYVAAPQRDAVIVLDASGRSVGSLALPPGSFPTNLCFGGADGTRLYVTCARGGRVFALDGMPSGALRPA